MILILAFSQRNPSASNRRNKPLAGHRPREQPQLLQVPRADARLQCADRRKHLRLRLRCDLTAHQCGPFQAASRLPLAPRNCPQRPAGCPLPPDRLTSRISFGFLVPV